MRRADIIVLGLSEGLAMKRLRRHAVAAKEGIEEEFYEQRCSGGCGRLMMWNPKIFPHNESHACEQCAPTEHWRTAIHPDTANAVFEEYL